MQDVNQQHSVMHQQESVQELVMVANHAKLIMVAGLNHSVQLYVIVREMVVGKISVLAQLMAAFAAEVK
jgi:hypothetical protein